MFKNNAISKKALVMQCVTNAFSYDEYTKYASKLNIETVALNEYETVTVFRNAMRGEYEIPHNCLRSQLDKVPNLKTYEIPIIDYGPPANKFEEIAGRYYHPHTVKDIITVAPLISDDNYELVVAVGDFIRMYLQ